MLQLTSTATTPSSPSPVAPLGGRGGITSIHTGVVGCEALMHYMPRRVNMAVAATQQGLDGARAHEAPVAAGLLDRLLQPCVVITAR